MSVLPAAAYEMPRADEPMVRTVPMFGGSLGEHVQFEACPDIAVGDVEADDAVLQRCLLRYMDALAVQISAVTAFGLEQVVALGVVVHPDKDLAVQSQSDYRRIDRNSNGVVAGTVHRIDDPCVPIVRTNVRCALFSNEGMVGGTPV